jgi:hypothetical protein
MRVVSVLYVLCVLCVPAIGAALPVKLTVTEDAGVARRHEPVTCGIPFPKGTLKDVDDLALKGSDGRLIRAAFTVINRWPEDKSVRWARVDAQLSVPAGGAATYTVTEGRVPETGPPGPFVRNGVGDLSMTLGGVKYSVANDKNRKAVVEEKNSMRLTRKITGKLTAKNGRQTYDYVVRIHFYAGSNRVKVVPTIIKKYGKRRDIRHRLEDLSLTLKLANAKDLTCALGGEAVPAIRKLGADDSAHVLVKDSEHWAFGGVVKGGGNPKKDKPLTLGWASLSGETGGVAAGVYRFWQTHPKAIEVRGDGTLTVGLMPKLAGDPQDFYTGMARTHEVLLVFHKGEKPEKLQDIFVAQQRPLLVQCTPEWYAKSGAFGSIAPAGADLAGDAEAEFRKFDARVSNWFDQLMGPRQDRWTKRGVTMDAYGWLAYGDTLHWVWQREPKGSPWNIAWDANYYDLPHLACLYFARTGDRKYYDFFVDHSWHLMDVDTIHWDPQFPQGGASRRCPATHHVGFDPPHHKEPIVNVAFDHHKSESLWKRYYLTGDHRALDVALDLLGHAYRHNFKGLSGRRVGHRLTTLVAGWYHTGDRKYLRKAREIVDLEMKRQKKNDGWHAKRVNFTCGIAMEGWAKYYQATGEQDVLDGMKAAADWLIDHPRQQRYSNLAFFVSVVYQKTGDAKYRDLALKLMWKSRPGHLSKDVGHMFRSLPNVTGCLWEK